MSSACTINKDNYRLVENNFPLYAKCIKHVDIVSKKYVCERTLCTIGSAKFIKAMCALHYFHIISIMR